ncbi:hypothetical protein [Dokdonella soli]|uniref:Uncharacterized protein n=1 Tax=Dokdonella soli TaxID=529810 RepID=A0ABP3TZR5_9GAMM
MIRLALLAAAFAGVAFVVSSAPPLPDVLVIEHTYDGVVQTVGHVTNWQYTGGHMLLEYVPDGDGIFRNGFEVVP